MMQTSSVTTRPRNAFTSRTVMATKAPSEYLMQRRTSVWKNINLQPIRNHSNSKRRVRRYSLTSPPSARLPSLIETRAKSRTGNWRRPEQIFGWPSMQLIAACLSRPASPRDCWFSTWIQGNRLPAFRARSIPTICRMTQTAKEFTLPVERALSSYTSRLIQIAINELQKFPLQLAREPARTLDKLASTTASTWRFRLAASEALDYGCSKPG